MLIKDTDRKKGLLDPFPFEGGNDTKTEKVHDEEKGAADSFSKLKSPQDKLEIVQYSIFMQLNEGEADMMVDKDELKGFEQFANPLVDEEGNVLKTVDDRLDEAFQKHQTLNFLKFREFQDFIATMELQDACEEIDKRLYKSYYRGCSLRCLLCGCCLRACRKVRLKQVANRLKRFKEME